MQSIFRKPSLDDTCCHILGQHTVTNNRHDKENIMGLSLTPSPDASASSEVLDHLFAGLKSEDEAIRRQYIDEIEKHVSVLEHRLILRCSISLAFRKLRCEPLFVNNPPTMYRRYGKLTSVDG